MSTRNLAGGALVAFGLILASLAWSGFSLSRTVLNPDRSEEIARHLYNDPFVKEFLEERVAQAVAAQMPLELGVANRDIKAAAASAMDSTEVEDTFVGALSTIHRQLLGLETPSGDSVKLNSPEIGEEIKFDLGKQVPGLGNALSSLDVLSVDLPVDSLPDVGSWRDKLANGVNLLALAALILVGVAFVITNNRPKILRRVGFWAIGAAAFWLILAVVIPVAAPVFLPESAALVGGFWGVAAQGMRMPSIVAVAAGVVAVVLSFIWGATSKHLVGARPTSAATRNANPIPAVPYATSNRPSAPVASSGPVSAARYGPPTGQPVPPRPPGGPTRDATQVYQGQGFTPPSPAGPHTTPPSSSASPPTPPTPPVAPPEHGPQSRWVEGQGYVDG